MTKVPIQGAETYHIPPNASQMKCSTCKWSGLTSLYSIDFLLWKTYTDMKVEFITYCQIYHIKASGSTCLCICTDSFFIKMNVVRLLWYIYTHTNLLSVLKCCLTSKLQIFQWNLLNAFYKAISWLQIFNSLRMYHRKSIQPIISCWNLNDVRTTVKGEEFEGMELKQLWYKEKKI